MPTAPQYVRLPDRLSDSILADLESGWSISGLDVQPYPKDDPVAAGFVDTALNSNKLEPAGKAEFEEVQDAKRASAELVNPDARIELVRPHQEHQIQEAAAQRRSARLQARMEAAGEDEDEEGTDDYSKLKKDQLVELAEQRGLDSSGTKDDLVARLEEADEDGDDEEE